MTEGKKFNNHIKPGYAVIIMLTLIAAGLTGNYLHFSILNAHFVFGSIFALLALQFFGFFPGVIAAAIISSYPYIAWNHSWAILTVILEVIIVGWIIRRTRINLLIADTLYWLIAGIPLGYICFYFISHLTVTNAMFLLTKQAINGIANALIARFLFLFLSFLRNSKIQLISFRELVTNLLAFFVLCTALIMLTFSSSINFDNTDRNIRSTLLMASDFASEDLGEWIDDKRLPVVYLAGLAGTLSLKEMQPHLEQAFLSETSFLQLVIINKNGFSIACSPPVDDLGQSNIGRSFIDSASIQILRQSLKPMLSHVVISRSGMPFQVSILLAPILSEGQYTGAVCGILDFDHIRNVLMLQTSRSGIQYTLVDKNRNIILTSFDEQQIMTPFNYGNGTFNTLEENLQQWIPTLPPNTSIIDLWGNSRYIIESHVGISSEWTLILEQAVAPFQETLYTNYRNKFFILFTILISSLLLAEFISRNIVKATEYLSRLTRDLPARLASNQLITWPESRILETNHLVEHFKKMAESLTSQFTEIEQINASLEKQVEIRTNELHKSEAQLSEAVQMARLGHWEYDVAKDLFTFNDYFYNIFHTNANEVGGYTLSSGEYTRRFIHPDDAMIVAEETLKAIDATDPDFSMELEHKILFADGSTGYTLIRFSIIKDQLNRTIKIYGINQDITERKLAEEQIKKSLYEKETLLRELYHRTKNNMQVIRSMLVLKASTYKNTEITSFVRDIEKKIITMALVHQKLYQSKDLSRINLNEYLEELLALFIQSYSVLVENLSFNIKLERISVLIDTAIPCGLIINELISNTLKHAFPVGYKGEISMKLFRTETGVIVLYFADNGIGVPDGFDTRKQQSLGLQTVITLVEQQLRGEILCETTQGMAYTIRFLDDLYNQRV